MKRRAALVDAVTGSTCIGFDAMSKGAEEKIKLESERQIFDENGRLLDIAGKLTLFIPVGDCRVKAHFLICRSLIVPILVETPFAKQHLRVIMPMERQLPIKNRDEVPVLESITNDDIAKDSA